MVELSRVVRKKLHAKQALGNRTPSTTFYQTAQLMIPVWGSVDFGIKQVKGILRRLVDEVGAQASREHGMPVLGEVRLLEPGVQAAQDDRRIGAAQVRLRECLKLYSVLISCV
jgi:hypothetical protein